MVNLVENWKKLENDFLYLRENWNLNVVLYLGKGVSDKILTSMIILYLKNFLLSWISYLIRKILSNHDRC